MSLTDRTIVQLEFKYTYDSSREHIFNDPKFEVLRAALATGDETDQTRIENCINLINEPSPPS